MLLLDYVSFLANCSLPTKSAHIEGGILVVRTFFSEEELLEKVKNLADELGRVPTELDWTVAKALEPEKYSSATTIKKKFITWNDFLEAAGLNVNRTVMRHIDEMQLMQQVKCLANELGRIPTHREFNDSCYTASSTAVVRRFGSWSNFLAITFDV